jgi:N-ethylmaleimide reductase
MAITKTKTLFTPVQIGSMTLKHRVVMAPMSRLRAQRPSGSPSDLMLEYYSQRASDGGLQLTEATAVSATGRGYYGAPGIVVTPDGFTQPSPHRALETEEIAGIIDQYRAAAANAKRAGFDGVEIMAPNGQFGIEPP